MIIEQFKVGVARRNSQSHAGFVILFKLFSLDLFLNCSLHDRFDLEKSINRLYRPSGGILGIHLREILLMDAPFTSRMLPSFLSCVSKNRREEFHESIK